jgi:hypothetical protein
MRYMLRRAALFMLILQVGCTFPFPPYCASLPFGNQFMDDFAFGRLSPLLVDRVTVYLINQNLNFYEDGCKKMQQLPKLEVADKKKIQQLMIYLTLPLGECDSNYNCPSTYKVRPNVLNEEYWGIIMARTTDKRVAHFIVKINRNKTIEIKAATHQYALMAKERDASIKLSEWVLPILQKIEKNSP